MSGLYMSSFSYTDEPELLYNCEGEYAAVSGALSGQDVAIIGVFKDIETLEGVTENQFIYWMNQEYNIAGTVVVEEGDVVGVILARDVLQTFFVFKVNSIAPNHGPMSITYGLFQYELHKITQASPGEDWSTPLQ